MMRRMAMAALVLAVVMPGCSDLFGMCGPQYGGATWHEAGLYDAVQGIAPDTSPRTGLPFVFSSEPRLVLVQVEWYREGSLGAPGVFMAAIDATGLVTAQAGNRTSRAEVDSGLRGFLGNVTAAPPAQVGEWVAAADDQALAWGVSDREGGAEYAVHKYSVLVQGPYRFEALFNSTVALSPECHEHSCARPGEVVRYNEEWHFRFELPTRAAHLPDGFTFEVDSHDVAHAKLPHSDENEEAARAKILEGLAQAGIPTAGARTATLDYAIC